MITPQSIFTDIGVVHTDAILIERSGIEWIFLVSGGIDQGFPKGLFLLCLGYYEKGALFRDAPISCFYWKLQLVTGKNAEMSIDRIWTQDLHLC